MKKWLRRILIAAALICLIGGFLFELESHVVRGWVAGEAFFDGRPTIYRRIRCDDWLSRFEDKDSLTLCTWLLYFEIPSEPGFRRFGVPDDLKLQGGTMGMPRETLWKRFEDLLRTKSDLERNRAYGFAPEILWATPDTEPVLQALQREEKYTWLATLALRRVKLYREVELRVSKEMKEETP